MTDTRLAPPYVERRAGVLGAYDSIVATLVRTFDGWFTPLVARFAIVSVLGLYYMNSAWGSLDGSLLNVLWPNDGAYGAMLPPIFERYEFEASAVPIFPWRFIVVLGVLGELLLPILIALGLFTRIAAAGLVVVIAVQSYVDINFHGLEGKYVGAPFDRFSDALIYDQRLLWVALLLIIVVRGAGTLSLDRLLTLRQKR